MGIGPVQGLWPRSPVKSAELLVLAVNAVRDYGAVGDGVTDDTTALANAAAAVAQGGTLFLPPGVYSVTALPSISGKATLLDSGAILTISGIPQQRLFYYHPLGLAYNVLTETFASFSTQSTTGSISADSKNLTLAASSDYKNGQGIGIIGAGPLPIIVAPSNFTVSAHGTVGTTSRTYAIVAVDGLAGVTADITATIVDGNAVLSTTNYDILSWTASTGSVSGYHIWLVGTGYLGSTSGTTFNYYGQAAITPPPGLTTTAPASALGQTLIAQIVSGGGTTALTLSVPATTAVVAAQVNHDDTTAIKAALGQAVKGELFLPSGTTYVSSPLNVNGVNAHIRLCGYGQAPTIIMVAPGSPFGIDHYIYNIGTQSSLEHVTLDGNRANQLLARISGTVAYDVTQPDINMITAQHFTGLGIFVNNCTLSPRIRNCRVTDCGMDNNQLAGIAVQYDIDATKAFADGEITGCESYNNGSDGISCTQGGWRIENNHSSGNGLNTLPPIGVGAAGVYCTGSTTLPVSRITISGNQLNGNSGDGLDLNNLSSLECVGNDSQYNQAAGISLAGVSDATVSGNVCMNNGQPTSVGHPSGIILQHTSTFTCNNIAVSNNVCVDDQEVPTQPYGILEVNNDSLLCIIEGNIVQGNITAPISTKSTGGTGMVVKNNQGYNPVGHIGSPPATPTSGNAVTNTLTGPCEVYLSVSGGTISALAKNGTAIPAGTTMVVLNPAETLTPTYTGTLTLTWFGE